MLKLYPETLPASLLKLPSLLKGKASQAVEIILASKCDYEGLLACEMAVHLLDEEMTTENTQYSIEESIAIFANLRQLLDWSMEAGRALKNNPIIWEKINFIDHLASACIKMNKRNYWYSMNEAIYYACSLIITYRKLLAGDNTDAGQSETLCAAEGA